MLPYNDGRSGCGKQLFQLTNHDRQFNADVMTMESKLARICTLQFGSVHCRYMFRFQTLYYDICKLVLEARLTYHHSINVESWHDNQITPSQSLSKTPVCLLWYKVTKCLKVRKCPPCGPFIQQVTSVVQRKSASRKEIETITFCTPVGSTESDVLTNSII